MQFVTRCALLSTLLVFLLSSAHAHETLKVQLTNMNPHVGQKFELRVVDKATGKETGRSYLDAIANHDFDIELEVIDVGGSYWIDFYADLNQNGVYDAPPADHAWRLELNDVQGDTVLTFSHNTSFTDINWVYMMSLDLSGMNPHQGQLFELRVVDQGNGDEVGRMRFLSLGFIDFTVQVPGLQLGRNYAVDFYADHNQNGRYDAPSADHAWRLQAQNVQGDVTLSFSHNTTFTDIAWVNALTLQLSGMNPHVGQKFEARVIDLYDMREVGRSSLDAIAVPDFSVEIPGIVPDRSYWVDFYADLNQNGQYDSPPADHTWREQFASNGNTIVNFSHNTAFTELNWVNLFTLNLSNMNPHVGQKFEARLIDLGTRHEVGRASLNAITQPDFEVSIPGVLPGHSYWVDFYADLNQNGQYDSPPADHVWRDMFMATGDASVDFTHNTTFTDTGWEEVVTLKLANMNPHLSQQFQARVIDLSTMHEVGRVNLPSLLVPEFAVSIPGIQIGGEYWLDFYADHNQNGVYDSPPADHTWREAFTGAANAMVEFTHNTNFTEINWVDLFTLNLANMNPHVGQKFEARVIDLASMHEVGRASLPSILVPNFSVSIPGLTDGGSYWVDFYADHNQNGLHDGPPADHTWREQFTSNGDASVDFSHNTSFTDFDWPYLFTLNLSNMNPHVGQKFEMRVVDTDSDTEVGRAALPSILVPNFSVSVPGVADGGNYRVDYYADLNQNGLYDAPPADHAWRDAFTANGDAAVDFSHNTNFTDIEWNYLFTLQLQSMSPHVGQLFEMRVVDENENEIGRTRLSSILLPNFSVSVPGIQPGVNYRADYYADLNQNGGYDAPPADHAWRDPFATAAGDTVLVFTHNTNFTDIQWPPTTGIERDEAGELPTVYALSQNYPNPFNPETAIQFALPKNAEVKLTIFNSLGQTVRTLLNEALPRGSYKITWDGRNEVGQFVPSGVYFYRIQTEGFVSMRRMILMK